MSPKKTIVVSSCILVALLIAGGLTWFLPSLLTPKEVVHAASNLPYNATANGPYSVKGNTVVGADGKQYIFHGIGRDGLEYNCSGEGPLDSASLAHMGPGTTSGANYYWGANTVRLPLSEGFWIKGAPGYPCTAAQYQDTVKKTVDTLTALHLNVVIDLQWADAGGQSGQGGGAWAMPDADSLTFWTQVATIYKGYSNVLFEAYNEPHTVSWQCWYAGGCTVDESGYSDDCKCSKQFAYTVVGMQAVADAIRKAGANNLILVAGLGWGYELSQIPKFLIAGGNIVYDTHPYPYQGKLAQNWDASFGNLAATYPIISAENGQYDCKSDYVQQLYNYLDAHRIGWFAWAWTVDAGNGCGYPSLVTDYQGKPSVSTGQYVYDRLRGYAATSGPVAKTWYFAEGRVGAGFREFITLGNPDRGNSCIVNLQFIQENGGPVVKRYIVNPSSRKTIDVASELGTTITGRGISVAAVVTNDSTSPCPGFIAERPIYFNWHGNNSGTDVVGATQTNTKFYFADVALSAGYSAFLSVLNPPGGQSAHVTASYYAGGRQVGTQSIDLPGGARSTISPAAISLPAHSAAIITSNQPVVVERSAYATNVNGGFAGTVTGASTIVGAQNLSNQWFLAEGFVGQNSSGGKTQENLLLANLDASNTAAAVTINLEYINGTKRSFNLTIGPLNQVIWNVNAQSNGAPSKEVSVDITSSGAAIVVARQMFFNYAHTIGSETLRSTGMTEVPGQIGTYQAYNFAEGYNKTGYNEWLTLQNPTAKPELISVTLVNSMGQSKTVTIPVGHNTRATFDVTAYVRANMAAGQSDFRYYEVSMSVQTLDGSLFVAERPMYFNTAGSILPAQGGTVAFGYSGS